jgi:hypothetical protein
MPTIRKGRDFAVITDIPSQEVQEDGAVGADGHDSNVSNVSKIHNLSNEEVLLGVGRLNSLPQIRMRTTTIKTIKTPLDAKKERNKKSGLKKKERKNALLVHTLD